ncbi:hypothetical protein QT972_00065 [Microcoleus sp. herbarium7]|uniref:hypothetical protein n=1 Tax=Microcoleus sp. herbarium7 TaxID=3055435 RepID=UPI002FCFE41D
MQISAKGGVRKGSGRRKKPAGTTKIQWWVYPTEKELEDFKAVGGTAEQVVNWIRAYPMARGETDRLLAQSPLAAELLAYLEATGAPEDLCDRLESLIVQRASDEVKIAEGVTKTKDGAYII